MPAPLPKAPKQPKAGTDLFAEAETETAEADDEPEEELVFSPSSEAADDSGETQATLI